LPFFNNPRKYSYAKNHPIFGYLKAKCINPYTSKAVMSIDVVMHIEAVFISANLVS